MSSYLRSLIASIADESAEVMTELSRALRGIDTTTPNVARIYDFLLGGKDSFAADRPVALESVHHARQLGISAVFQEFSLIPTLTVEENLFLGAEITSRGLLSKHEMHRRAQAILDRVYRGLGRRRRAARQGEEVVSVACTCKIEHPGRPDDEAGCGAYWNVVLHHDEA